MFATDRSWPVFCLATAMVMLPPLAAQGDALPPLTQILDQHRKALGAERVLAASVPLLLKGRCDSTGDEESGPIEILVQSPKVVFDLNRGALRMGYNGDSVWRSGAGEALQQRKGRQFAELVTVFDPARARWWREWYPQMAVTGVRPVEKRDAFVLETVSGSPLTERLFIDRQSGLLVRDELAAQYTFTFSDYRAVNGVMTAFEVRETAPNGIVYNYHFESIAPVNEVDASRFVPR